MTLPARTLLLAAFALAVAAAHPAGAQTAARGAGRPPAGVRPTVLVVGDRFADALADGLEADGAAAPSRTTGEGFGLARPSFSDSLGTIRERLGRPDRPALAAVMVGAGDDEPLADADGRHPPGTPEWARLYGERVDTLAAVFAQAHVPLVWVGLPAVRSPELSAAFARQNGIVRDRAARDGASYVDTFDAFTDSAGRYSPVGPDAEGAPAKLRRGDGFGFTRAGARKLASFLAPAIARAGGAAAAPEVAGLTIERARGFDAALDVDVSAQIRREAAKAPGQPAPPAGPAAGPVLPLTAPPSARDGQLASLAPPRGAPAGADPAAPRPGRADDFAWPRP